MDFSAEDVFEYLEKELVGIDPKSGEYANALRQAGYSKLGDFLQRDDLRDIIPGIIAQKLWGYVGVLIGAASQARFEEGVSIEKKQKEPVVDESTSTPAEKTETAPEEPELHKATEEIQFESAGEVPVVEVAAEIPDDKEVVQSSVPVTSEDSKPESQEEVQGVSEPLAKPEVTDNGVAGDVVEEETSVPLDVGGSLFNLLQDLEDFEGSLDPDSTQTKEAEPKEVPEQTADAEVPEPERAASPSSDEDEFDLGEMDSVMSGIREQILGSNTQDVLESTENAEVAVEASSDGDKTDESESPLVAVQDKLDGEEVVASIESEEPEQEPKESQEVATPVVDSDLGKEENLASADSETKTEAEVDVSTPKEESEGSPAEEIEQKVDTITDSEPPAAMTSEHEEEKNPAADITVLEKVEEVKDSISEVVKEEEDNEEVSAETTPEEPKVEDRPGEEAVSLKEEVATEPTPEAPEVEEKTEAEIPGVVVLDSKLNENESEINDIMDEIAMLEAELDQTAVEVEAGTGFKKEESNEEVAKIQTEEVSEPAPEAPEVEEKTEAEIPGVIVLDSKLNENEGEINDIMDEIALLEAELDQTAEAGTGFKKEESNEEVAAIQTEEDSEPVPEAQEVEEKPEEVAAEPTPEEPKVEEKPEEVAAEPTPEEPKVEEKTEEVAAEPTPEEPKVEEKTEEVAAEPTPEEPKVEEKTEEVAAEPTLEDTKVEEQVGEKPEEETVSNEVEVVAEPTPEEPKEEEKHEEIVAEPAPEWTKNEEEPKEVSPSQAEVATELTPEESKVEDKPGEEAVSPKVEEVATEPTPEEPKEEEKTEAEIPGVVVLDSKLKENESEINDIMDEIAMLEAELGSEAAILGMDTKESKQELPMVTIGDEKAATGETKTAETASTDDLVEKELERIRKELEERVRKEYEEEMRADMERKLMLEEAMVKEMEVRQLNKERKMLTEDMAEKEKQAVISSEVPKPDEPPKVPQSEKPTVVDQAPRVPQSEKPTVVDQAPKVPQSEKPTVVDRAPMVPQSEKPAVVEESPKPQAEPIVEAGGTVAETKEPQPVVEVEQEKKPEEASVAEAEQKEEIKPETAVEEETPVATEPAVAGAVSEETKEHVVREKPPETERIIRFPEEKMPTVEDISSQYGMLKAQIKTFSVLYGQYDLQESFDNIVYNIHRFLRGNLEDVPTEQVFYVRIMKAKLFLKSHEWLPANPENELLAKKTVEICKSLMRSSQALYNLDEKTHFILPAAIASWAFHKIEDSEELFNEATHTMNPNQNPLYKAHFTFAYIHTLWAFRKWHDGSYSEGNGMCHKALESWKLSLDLKPKSQKYIFWKLSLMTRMLQVRCLSTEAESEIEDLCVEVTQLAAKVAALNKDDTRYFESLLVMLSTWFPNESPQRKVLDLYWKHVSKICDVIINESPFCGSYIGLYMLARIKAAHVNLFKEDSPHSKEVSKEIMLDACRVLNESISEAVIDENAVAGKLLNHLITQSQDLINMQQYDAEKKMEHEMNIINFAASILDKVKSSIHGDHVVFEVVRVVENSGYLRHNKIEDSLKKVVDKSIWYKCFLGILYRMRMDFHNSYKYFSEFLEEKKVALIYYYRALGSFSESHLQNSDKSKKGYLLGAIEDILTASECKDYSLKTEEIMKEMHVTFAKICIEISKITPKGEGRVVLLNGARANLILARRQCKFLEEFLLSNFTIETDCIRAMIRNTDKEIETLPLIISQLELNYKEARALITAYPDMSDIDEEYDRLLSLYDDIHNTIKRLSRTIYMQCFLMKLGGKKMLKKWQLRYFVFAFDSINYFEIGSAKKISEFTPPSAGQLFDLAYQKQFMKGTWRVPSIDAVNPEQPSGKPAQYFKVNYVRKGYELYVVPLDVPNCPTKESVVNVVQMLRKVQRKKRTRGFNEYIYSENPAKLKKKTDIPVIEDEEHFLMESASFSEFSENTVELKEYIKGVRFADSQVELPELGTGGLDSGTL